MAVKASATEAAERWSQGFSGASGRYTAGINAVTTAPGQLAALQKNLYVQKVQEQSNVWASKVAAVPLQTWKDAATTVGAQRLATGAQKGAPKMQAFMANFLPKLDSVVKGLGPRGTYDQNVARLNAYVAALHQQKGTF